MIRKLAYLEGKDSPECIMGLHGEATYKFAVTTHGRTEELCVCEDCLPLFFKEYWSAVLQTIENVS